MRASAASYDDGSPLGVDGECAARRQTLKARGAAGITLEAAEGDAGTRKRARSARRAVLEQGADTGRHRRGPAHRRHLRPRGVRAVPPSPEIVNHTGSGSVVL